MHPDSPRAGSVLHHVHGVRLASNTPIAYCSSLDEPPCCKRAALASNGYFPLDNAPGCPLAPRVYRAFEHASDSLQEYHAFSFRKSKSPPRRMKPEGDCAGLSRLDPDVMEMAFGLAEEHVLFHAPLPAHESPSRRGRALLVRLLHVRCAFLQTVSRCGLDSGSATASGPGQYHTCLAPHTRLSNIYRLSRESTCTVDSNWLRAGDSFMLGPPHVKHVA
jgi:hypothetical protein